MKSSFPSWKVEHWKYLQQKMNSQIKKSWPFSDSNTFYSTNRVLGTEFSIQKLIQLWDTMKVCTEHNCLTTRVVQKFTKWHFLQYHPFSALMQLHRKRTSCHPYTPELKCKNATAGREEITLQINEVCVKLPAKTPSSLYLHKKHMILHLHR